MKFCREGRGFCVILLAGIALFCGLAKRDCFATSKMYWTDGGEGKIQQAEISGAGLTDLIANLGGASGIAVSVETGKIYWTNPSEHKIQFADVSGSNINDLVIDGVEKPVDIAMDFGNGKMYWIDTGLKAISRADMDGDNLEIIINTGLKLPKAITVDTSAGKIYWSDCWYPASINRANLDGSGVETIISTDLGDPSGLALDLRAGKIYWTDATAATAKIERANLDGSGREQLVTSGLHWPRGIVLDVDSDKMYWVDSWQPGVIKFANLNGTNVKALVSNLGNILDIALDVRQPTSLSVSGPSQVYEDYTAQYTATASYSDGTSADVTNIVAWSVEGNSGASINSDGLLEVGSITSPDGITVKAQYTAGGGTVEAQMLVAISLPVSLSMSGPLIAKEVAKSQYRAFVKYDNGQSREVTNTTNWTAQPDTYAQIDTAGLLTVQHIEAAQDIIIYAQYTRSVSTQEAQITVQLIPLQTLRVPGQYVTIQAAIDAATEYDTVVIADGTYTGAGNRDIRFRGKPLILKSENGSEKCIIDCQGVDQGFGFYDNEGPYSVVEGFTIKNSYRAIDCWYGSPTIRNCVMTANIYGAIYCGRSSPVITDCAITGNTYGGVICDDSSAVIANCIIANNSTENWGGGGIYSGSGDVRIENCLITGNKVRYWDWYNKYWRGWGGGICNASGKITVVNCVVASNTSAESGGGIWSEYGQTTIINSTLVSNTAVYGGGIHAYVDSATITNSILWANKGNGSQLAVNGATVAVSYSDVKGLSAGVGVWNGGSLSMGGTNINADPSFINPAGDYHLLKGSPCINAGDPQFTAGQDETDIEGNKRIIRGRVDMGAYEAFYNETPVACIADGNQTIEAQGPWGAKVTLDGSCSSDADSTAGTNDDIVYFEWYKVDPCDPNYEGLLGSGQQYDCNLPLGQHTIVLEVTDKAEASNTTEITITIEDTTPPTITCPNDIRLEATGPDGAAAAFAATASDIADSAPVISYSYSPGGMFPLGTTNVICTAADDSGNSSNCSFNITVVDTTPPDFELSVEPTGIWPPNNKMVRITPAWVVGDICDPAPEVSLAGITVNEVDETPGDSNILIDTDGSIYLRAERNDSGSGRIYTITYQARDHSENVTVRSATVTVPHDMGDLK